MLLSLEQMPLEHFECSTCSRNTSKLTKVQQIRSNDFKTFSMHDRRHYSMKLGELRKALNRTLGTTPLHCSISEWTAGNTVRAHPL
eukprot:648459-Amphidinium_carterae.1